MAPAWRNFKNIFFTICTWSNRPVGAKILPRFQIEGKTDVWISQVRRVNLTPRLLESKMAVTVCRALAIDGWFWALVDWILIFCFLSGRLFTSTAVNKDTFLYFSSIHNLATLIISKYHTCAFRSRLVRWVK